MAQTSAGSSSLLRALVPAPVRALRWHLHWLFQTDAFRKAPLVSLWRVFDWDVTGLFRSVRRFSTPDGLKFVSPVRNFTALALYVDGRKDLEIARFIGKRLRPGDVFVDVGANIGAYTIPAAKLVGPLGQVLAYEAHPGLAGHLREAVSLNQAANVTVLNEGVGDAPGSLRITYVDANPGETHVATSAERGTDVPMVTLDASLAERGISQIHYLKIDVEGFEPQVIRGGAQVIGNSPDLVVQTELVERHLSRYGGSVSQVAEVLRGLGLRPFGVTAEGCPVAIADGAPLMGDVLWMRPA